MPEPGGGTLQAAIVGSGPGGFYAAEALLRSQRRVEIDILERLPTPFGLVRGGVAPDHAKTKSIAAAFDRLARSPAVRFLGNVQVGKDVEVDELRARYDVVVLACGADQGHLLGVPGESLAGIHEIAAFVGWYNGHPDHRELAVDLSHEVALVVGHGNVAVDVCRILCSPIDRLASTDIAAHALEALAQSRIREVHLVGRRGPVQARFTNAELRELGSLAGTDIVVEPTELELDAASAEEAAAAGNEVAARNLRILEEFAQRRRTHPRCIRIRFLSAPLDFTGPGRIEQARLQAMRLEGPVHGRRAVPTGESCELGCGLVVKSTGYRGRPLRGVPFDDRTGTFPNADGRLLLDGAVVPGIYVAGWIKRGPSGVIGTNRADSAATVEAILADWPALRRRGSGARPPLPELLDARGVKVTSYEGWQRIDAAEIKRGAPAGKPREKFTSVSELLHAATGASS